MHVTTPLPRALLIATCLLALAGCQKAVESGDRATAGNPASAPTPARPQEIASARLVTGRVICPLENINGNPVRESRSFVIGSKATLAGWSTVADPKQPTPPMAYIVFRSVVPDGSGDLFWTGVRVARPDLAQTDPRMLRAGYAASGAFPRNPGKYRVLVWVGDSAEQRECDTKEVLELHG